MEKAEINSLKELVLNGGKISRDDALRLATEAPLDDLCDAADEICRHFMPADIDSCSIVNARSGMCGEDCKWCAQATRHHTGCATYNFINEDDVFDAASRNESEGIHRFSLVTSGRTVMNSDLDKFCDIFRKLSEKTGLYLCASMGLVDIEGMRKLKQAGVKRYHCNMETFSGYFPSLCTTHTPEDKRATIRAAREAGLEVCSGGIIGMGEDMATRVDFAFELAQLDICSVPINILNPIKNTPLESTPLISEEEIIRTAAIFRFILPDKSIRFAGGRLRLCHESMLRMLRGGVNGVLMGDMLTTVSNDVASDRVLFREAGWNF